MARLGNVFSVITIAVLCAGVAQATEQIVLKDLSIDTPMVLDENADYRLDNVSVIGLVDCAALTLAGQISSVTIERSSFGRVWSGEDGRAAGLDCSAATIGRFRAFQTSFFDAENQLAAMREGTFGRVTFEQCRFVTSATFLKEIQSNNPWRDWPPVTEFYNIERLELLDNEFSNTTVIIHPSVKQVILRGRVPGLKIVNQQSTHVVELKEGQVAETVAPLPGAMAGAWRF